MARSLLELADKLHAASEDFTLDVPVCMTCLQLRYGTRGELKKALRAFFIDLYKYGSHFGAYTRIFPGLLETHEAATTLHHYTSLMAHGVRGTRSNPEVRARLIEIDPDLASGRIRFDERAPLNQEIVAVLAEMGRPDLTFERAVPGSYKGLQGTRTNLDEEEVRAALEFRVAMKAVDDWKHDRQTCGTITSGQQILNALSKVKCTDKLNELQIRGGDDDTATPAPLLAWFVFDFYLLLTGNTDLARRVSERWGRDVPPLDQALVELGVPQEERALIIGDVAVIQFHLDRGDRGSMVLEGVSTLPDLYQALDAIAYPRQASQDDDLRQRFQKLYRDVASTMDRVVLAQIDWSPLLKSVRFPHSKKSGS